MPKEIYLYTDGACSGNPGPGGWGVVIQEGGSIHELSGGDPQTTNNRMEMIAAIKGIEATSSQDILNIYTDSSYLKDGMLVWLPRWQKNGWITTSQKPVKNKDLWEILANLNHERQINWHWLKGHAGHPQNERADFLAGHAIMKQMMQAVIQKTVFT